MSRSLSLPPFLLLAFGILLLAPRAGRGEEIRDRAAIQPSHVYARVQCLLAELELVRQEVGGPQNSHPEITVSGVEPRENYFQAVTLYRKAERLCSERTGDAAALLPPAPPAQQLQPADVYGAVTAALSQIRQIKSHLIIRDTSPEPAAEDSRTPTDVFRAIVQANRQLNLLLEQPVTPTAVYQQISLAVVSASHLLTRFPDAVAPKYPGTERRQRPADVHKTLVDCAAQLRTLLKKSGFAMLEVDWKLDAQRISPSDVYDVATLLVSELQFLESQLPGTPQIALLDTLPPGKKLPSDNVERAKFLAAQLAELNVRVAAKPDWLKAPGNR